MTLSLSRRIDTGVPSMPADEWRVRCDLAAMYRLVALNGWDDVIFTHISARVPGHEHHFLMNPLHLTFEEITASALVKVDLEGNLIGAGPEAAINSAGYVIHSAVHAARPDAHYVVHLHTLDGMAVSCQTGGLLPLSQTSIGVTPQLAYHDYEGVAVHIEERARLVADLGDKRLMILRNHGTLAIGRSAGEAWLGMYMLERACSLQIRALSAGRDGVLLAPDAAQAQVARMVEADQGSQIFGTAWEALLRRIGRDSPGFDT